jgi:hypothetical protein
VSRIPEWLTRALENAARRDPSQMEPPLGVDRAKNMTRPAWMLEGEPKQHFPSPEAQAVFAKSVAHENREKKYGPVRQAPPNQTLPQEIATGLGIWGDEFRTHLIGPQVDNWREGATNIRQFLLDAMRRGNGR